MISLKKTFRMGIGSVILCLFSAISYAQMSSSDNLHLLDLIQNQRYDLAAEFLKEKNPEPITDLKILQRIANNLQQAGKLTEAGGYYQRILDLDPANIPALSNFANINQRKGNIPLAMEYQRKIVEIDSTNFPAWKQLSYLAESYETVLQAGPYLNRANELNSIDGDIAYSYSKFLRAIKKPNEAAEVLDIAIQADSSNLILLRGKAEVMAVLQQWKEVIRLTTYLKEQGEVSAAIMKLQGEAFLYDKQYREALAVFLALEEKEMKSEGSLYFTALCYRNLKDYPKAVEYLKKAVAEGISPNISHYYAAMASAEQENRQFRKAIDSYQKSLSYGVTPITYYSMARIYDQNLKESGNALRYYKRYIASKPPAEHRSYVEYSTHRIGELSKGR